MRLTLSPEFRAAHALSFSGLMLFVLLILPFVALLVIGAYLYFRFHEAALAASALNGLYGVIACDLGIWACLRRRKLILAFCRWQESEASDENLERRALVGGARDAFMAGNFSKSIRLLERYLEQRPADNCERLNLATCLVLENRSQDAASLIELAGDPRRQLRYLLKSKSPLGWFSLNRAFSLSQISKIRRLWPFMLGIPAALALCAVLVSAEAGKIKKIVDERNSEETGLNEQDFEVFENDNLRIFHHNPANLDAVVDVATSALEYNLNFFGMPGKYFKDKKIKFFMCGSKEEYLRLKFSNPLQGGVAVPSKGEFYTYTDRPGGVLGAAFEVTVAHELSHICYEQLNPNLSAHNGLGVYFKKKYDTWLNEGLASHIGYSYMCERRRVPMSSWIKENVFKGIAKRPMPFKFFLRSNPWQAGISAERISQFYTQGHSMVYVLIQYYGKDQFFLFLKNFSRTQDMNQAFKETYPSIQSIDDLAGIWTLFYK